jgi:hypothetical protein
VKVVSVTFSGSPREYDYLAPMDDIRVGDAVIVMTKRGEATVIVTAIKDHSDRATARIERVLARDVNTLF